MSVDVLRVTVTNTTTGGYTVEQLNAIDHPTPGTSEENIQFSVNYRVTDHDGDTIDNTLTIDVDDDMPTATADIGNVNEGSLLTVAASGCCRTTLPAPMARRLRRSGCGW